MTRTFQYVLKPTKNQRLVLESWLLACQRLYNAALEQRRDVYRTYRKYVGLYEQQKQLTELRQSDPAWRDIPVKIARSALCRLDLAFRSFFRRVKYGNTPGFPRFRARNRYDSFDLGSDPTSIRDSRIHIPKLGWVKVYFHRELKGKVLCVILRRGPKRWWVSFSCDVGPTPEKKSVRPDRIVGIDLGLTSFATLSDGTKVENPRYFRRAEMALAKRQRSLFRKQKGSNGRKRAKILVATAHEHVANQRTDFARKLASSLFAQYDLIAYEDLNIKGLATGMLAKSVQDAAWRKFITSLVSKAEGAGKHAVAVDPRGTTQACSACGAIVPKGLNERTHSCACGLVLDRDENAARNVLALGRSVAAIGPKDRNDLLPGLYERMVGA